MNFCFRLVVVFVLVSAAGNAATLYVSTLGDNSDGASWATAFHTIQQALDAVPEGGGHRVIVRPDTYMEAMLSPQHRGTAGAYNTLIGDVDGRYGSGASGAVIIDSGDPDKGFKSYDWHGTIRSNMEGWSEEHTDETFSAIAWDRWKLQHLYVTGGDGGLFWDLTDQVKPFTVVVEDCVGIGRAFGGGVANCLSRDDEPIVFRRCHLWALDWWGDTAGAYVRVENETMPTRPDVYFEDCVMASPQCALKGGNFGFETKMRISVKGSKLVALNFSQPHGTPIDGAIQSVEDGKLLHVDLEDTTVMGYKVFGVRVNKETVDDLEYTTTGNVQAYVQFQQEVPEGFYRLQQWPADVFGSIVPPMPATRKPALEDVQLYKRDLCEVTPFIWEDRLHILECIRPGSGGSREDYYLIVRDAETGAEVARFAEGYGLASAYVHDGEMLVTASRYADNNWNDVTLFRSRDLKAWNEQVIITQEAEHLFNSSLCHGPDGFVLAYESNDPQYPAFTTKFAVSADLDTWEKRPDATFGLDRYTACPDIHYVDGHYYVLYLERQPPRHYFETYVTRSRDLIHWERSGANPVLAPSMLDDGINASDPALVEVDGETRVYYAVGDQRTWMNIKQGTYPGRVKEFLTGFYARPGVPDPGTKAARENLPAPPPDTTWFQDAKFGVFVHWGLYALHGRNDTRDYASWAMHDDKIPVSEYAPYADQFDPQRFDADAWMELVRDAGARYMTFTSKHHEGFSLFDSALTNYDTADRAAGRDIVGELVTAARAHDVRIGFYYSMLDWYHPDFEKDLGKYVDAFLFGQVRELCTNYGPIDGIWFDGEWDHPESTWRAEELVAMIHRLQPDALVNDRLGKGVRGETELADFYTREQMSEIGKVVDGEDTRVRPWEACLTIGRSWGYRVDDGTPKSSTELICTLVDVVSRGGNLLLNVGPTPDGEIPEPLAQRLRAIGDWLARNGEGIYGTRAVRGITASAGKLTGKGDRVYVHLEEHPGAALQLTGLPASPKEAWVVSTGERLDVDGETGSVALPEMLPEGAVTSIGVAW